MENQSNLAVRDILVKKAIDALLTVKTVGMKNELHSKKIRITLCINNYKYHHNFCLYFLASPT